MDETTELQSAYNEAIAQKEKVMNYKKFVIAKKQFEEGEALREAYKQIVDVLAPKGKVAQAILSKAVEPLQTYCDEVADALFGGEKGIFLDVSNGMKINLKKKDDSLVSFENCSTGEKFCLLLIIMDMINQLSGYNILVLDNLDSLDVDTLALLTTYLNESVYDHVFIACVESDAIKSLVDNFILL